ncbi:hypothetical protein TWF718_005676 [Orbilia javanica]|uniref:Uncharacterized protein n=1 Tax=Orbilia javanica TaxID=47235 RepID=A0AAN8N168_9PEZI
MTNNMPSKSPSPRLIKSNANSRAKLSPESILPRLAEAPKTVGSSKGIGGVGGWALEQVECDPDGCEDRFAFEVVVRK